MRLVAGWMTAAAALAATGFAPQAVAAQARPDERAFFGLYKELVETNTTLSSGSCTQAAQQVAARLKAAGSPTRT